MANGTAAPDNRDQQITTWWHQVEDAVICSKPARARRLLHWIITCQPDEEEAWLALAHLTSNPKDRLQILHEAYTLHPESRRVISRLAEARAEFLAANVGELVRPRHLIRCLPDERRQPRPGNGASHNGNHSDPLDEVGHTSGLLSRFLHVVGIL